MKPIAVLWSGLVAFPLPALAQTVEYSTNSDGVVYSSTVYDTASTTSTDPYATTSTDYTSGSAYPSSTLSSSPMTGSTYVSTTATDASSPTTLPAIQTVPFTGQALLVGTCNIPQFTILAFPDGGSLEVPLIGCSDDRPDCCPSLNLTQFEPEQTGSASASGEGSEDEDHPTTSWTGTTPSPTPTGVISLLSKAPLTVCPNDMKDLDPVCCPIGFSQYGQSIVGNLPCVSSLTTTVYSPDASVLASITSAISVSMAAASTTSTPTVSVIINQVFALGLPCADDEGEESEEATHLSNGAKAGIGAGAGVLALLLIGGLWACLAVRHRRRGRMRKLEAAATEAGGPIRPGAAQDKKQGGAYGASSAEPKHMSVATTVTPGSPALVQHPGYGSGMAGYQHPHPHGYGPAFGYTQPPPQPNVMMHQNQAYHVSPSPPPVYGYGPHYNEAAGPNANPLGIFQGAPGLVAHGGQTNPSPVYPVEIDAGELKPNLSPGILSRCSDTHSQVTSTTAVNSTSLGAGAAELGSDTYSDRGPQSQNWA
ncbi:hypothetical protein A1O3_06598 [Capronia epimyces CBS 606.96]|uniref:Hydrophobin n=1 Tax=Capronia epimyces CBS 606.96 TaxID=1182542 RepID=W9XRC3_9EURO|nr:uncharacterized protein A1O3_06598 [Capronia epimyces CBS 606.96]EXJ82783.1 hypothetical protein A1O3_06598 [Capronia epimyces CBS 606.96]